MSREIRTDFNKLLDFIENYSLSEQLTDPKYKYSLTQIHKKYYSLLTFVMEIKIMTDNDGNNIISGKQKDFILESVSDIGNSVFLTINGAYKSSKLMLRSSIETFLKGISIDCLDKIDEEKRIYQMFDQISEIDFFKNDNINKELFIKLNSLYAELSKDIHTAGLDQMQHTSSLDYFPTKSIPKLVSIAATLNEISRIFLTLLSIRFNAEFHRMHHTNKAIIIGNIRKKHRQKIHNIE